MEEELKSIQKFYDVIIEFFVNYSFQLLGAIIVILIGWFIARKVSSGVERLCLNKEIDVTLTKFIVNIVKFSVIIGASIIAVGKLGIALTPFIAGIGAASLGAGLALQGTLSNYGAGIAIILTRPFIVGNTVSIEGVSGVVQEIKLGYTRLETEDGEIITIPNKHIVGEVLVNSFEYKIVESVVGIDYTNDPEKAIKVLNEVLDGFKDEVSQDPKSQVGIKEFGDFSINLELRYWAMTHSYYQTQYKINLAIHKAFKKNSIQIPFPTQNIIVDK
jgi:small conductance mechanosensitive channel